MTDETRAHLVALKREFIQTNAELTALSATMPSGRAILAGEATEDPADRERWNALHDKLGSLATEIRRHPAFENLTQLERGQLDAAASKEAHAGD